MTNDNDTRPMLLKRLHAACAPDQNDIQIGDFIKARNLGTCCGIVTGSGTIPFGKEQIHVYGITNANGKIDYIPYREAVLIAR